MLPVTLQFIVAMIAYAINERMASTKPSTERVSARASAALLQRSRRPKTTERTDAS
jgi:hypothetical protein